MHVTANYKSGWAAALLIFTCCAATAQPGGFEAGMAAFQKRDYAKAIAVLEEAVKSGKTDVPRYRDIALLLGQCYFLTARNPEASQWMERAIAAGVQTTEVQYVLGNASIRNRDADRARAAFARMFGVPEKSAAAHLLTAQMMVRQEFEDFAEKARNSRDVLQRHRACRGRVEG